MSLDQKLYIITIILGSVLAGIVYFMQNHREKRERKTLIKDVEDSHTSMLNLMVSYGILPQGGKEITEKQKEIFYSFIRCEVAFRKLKNNL